jgi:hypothetical protein
MSDGVQFAFGYGVVADPAASETSDGVQFAFGYSVRAAVSKLTDGIRCAFFYSVSGVRRSVWRLPDRPSNSKWRS